MKKKTWLRSILAFCLMAVTMLVFAAARPLAAETNAYSLTLKVDPPGSGTAVANPGPPYSQNQSVTLTATANPGYTFDRWVLADDTKWWDAGWDYRVEVTAGASGYARKNKPAEFDLNFTQLWTSLGTTGTLDPNSIRVVEVDVNDNVLDADVPFQFDKASDFNAATKAAGTVVLIMEGNTGAGATRTYHVYFDVTGKGFSTPNVTPQVTLSEQADEGVGAFKLQTPTGTIFIHKSSAGVSGYEDVNGNDWISWSEATGAHGAFRGIPNATGGSNEAVFHPGKGQMTSTVLNQGPIKVTLHFLGKKASGDSQRWEGTYEIYPDYTVFTMVKARVSPALQYPFWFLYEGTPGGQLNPTVDFVVFSNGEQINAGQTRDGDLPDEEWAYVADPTVGTGRSIFLINNQDDTKNDTYFTDGAKVMTILGFGRQGSTLLLPNNTTPREFTFGLMDETLIDNAKPIIYNAYRVLNTNVGSAEARSGASLGTQNPVQFTITGEHTVTAQFKPVQYTVNVTISPPGTGTVTKSPDNPTYSHGEQVTLTATVITPGYNFAGWSGSGVSGTESQKTVTVTQNMNITATFAQNFTVTTSANPAAGGTVNLNPPGPSYAPGTEVTVTAVANSGYTFTEWSGDLSGSNPSETITVNGNMNIVANFGQPQFTFSATSAGNGTVDWTPKKASYAAGEVIEVTATPDSGFAFGSWTGDLASTVNPLTFPINGNTSVVANFVASQLYTLSVSVPGGGGTVTQNPPGPNYPSGTTVTLTAVPNAGKKFVQWGGDASGTNPSTQVTMTGNKAVTATFDDDGEPLTITIAPSGGGTVTKSPNQNFYLPGTVVTLTAAPTAGWTFVNWSGDASGTNLTTTVTIGADGADVTATFSPPSTFTLTTSVVGNGTIKISPEKPEYTFGEKVKLTAEPGSGAAFAGWSGSLTSTANPLSVTMNSNMNIVATFTVPAAPVSDHFDTCSLNAVWGSPINPTGDATFKVDGSHLRITVPEGATHNLWGDNKDAPRVMQAADNVDFQYVVKFDSTVTQTAQMQGIIVEGDAQNFARFEIQYNNGLKAYAATIEGTKSKARIAVDIVNPADAVYLRVTRTGEIWKMEYSGNGATWIEAGSFNKYTLNVTKAGIFAGNVQGKNSPAPAHTAVVDYFHNATLGPMPAERPLLDITIVGSGSVTANPPIGQLTCGANVTLTANPGLGATFSNWSGAVTGTQPTVSFLINGPKQVTATFSDGGMQYSLLPIIIKK